MKCELCGFPMPEGEEMFKYHGHSGPCPKPESFSRIGQRAAKEDRARRKFHEDDASHDR